jgi:hypothetical protein
MHSLKADQKREEERMQHVMLESLRLERERVESQEYADYRDQRLRRARGLIPDVPALNDPALNITFRFPERHVRRFPALTTPRQVRAFVMVELWERSSQIVRFGLHSSYPRLNLGPDYDDCVDGGQSGAADVDLTSEKEWCFWVVDLDA